MERGTAAPPQRMPRKLDRSAEGSAAPARSTSFQTVGTPSATVGRNVLVMFKIGSPCKNIWGMMSSQPEKKAVYAAPQALTWNMGTISNVRSRSDNPMELADIDASECSHVLR